MFAGIRLCTLATFIPMDIFNMLPQSSWIRKSFEAKLANLTSLLRMNTFMNIPILWRCKLLLAMRATVLSAMSLFVLVVNTKLIKSFVASLKITNIHIFLRIFSNFSFDFLLFNGLFSANFDAFGVIINCLMLTQRLSVLKYLKTFNTAPKSCFADTTMMFEVVQIFLNHNATDTENRISIKMTGSSLGNDIRLRLIRDITEDELLSRARDTT